MKPWQAFGLSVLIALSLHAVILFVPRIAEQGRPGPPSIELTLESARAAGDGPGAGQAGAMRASAAAPPAAAAPSVAPPTDPVYAQASVLAGPSEKSETSLLPPSTAPAEGSTGASDQAQVSTAASGGAGAAGGSGGGTASMAGGSGADMSGASGEAQPGAAASTTLAPRPRGEILPAYPRSAKRAGWQGVVTIRAFIDETGKVVSAVVLTSSGHESLDLAALEAVKNTRFDPAVRQSRPVSSPLLIPVRFQLN